MFLFCPFTSQSLPLPGKSQDRAKPRLPGNRSSGSLYTCLISPEVLGEGPGSTSKPKAAPDPQAAFCPSSPQTQYDGKIGTGTSYRLKVCVPPNPRGKSQSQCIGMRRQGLWEAVRSQRWGPHERGECPKRSPRDSLALFQLREQTRGSGRAKAHERALTGSKQAGTIFLDFRPLER